MMSLGGNECVSHAVMHHAHLPQSYQAWYDCMTVTYRITLTQDYIDARIAELHNTDHEATKAFIMLCGVDYHAKVLVWLKQAKAAFIQ